MKFILTDLDSIKKVKDDRGNDVTEMVKQRIRDGKHPLFHIENPEINDTMRRVFNAKEENSEASLNGLRNRKSVSKVSPRKASLPGEDIL